MSSFPGATVLVVDDHEDTRRLARIILEQEGYRVSEAETGTAALRDVRERQPELVLLDIVLPEVDGLEVARRIRADAALDDARIVAMTALGRGAMREESLLAGCDDFIEKPFRIAALREIVFNQLLARRRSLRLVSHLTRRVEYRQARVS